jgi:titin
MIGGTTAGTGNVIAYNGTFGITTNAGMLSLKPFAVLGNSIFSNGNLGIDLGSDGVSTNDAGDSDTGPNGLQNFPLLSSGGPNAGSTTTINGTLNSKSNTIYRLEFFANATCDSSGYGEGQTYLGFTNVTTNGSGDVTFAANLTAVVSVGQFITATATDPSYNTSEFSACVPVVAISALTAAPTLYYYRTTSVPLTWTGVTWATGYVVQWDDNLAMSSPTEIPLSNSTQSIPITVPGDGVYYWRVGAKQVNSTIIRWSTPQKFTVDVP